jgi:ATP-binding protein involved in chromosome partitioning
MAESLDVQAALAAVAEPELRRSIVELGMVQGVAVDGKTAVVAIAAPLPGEASRAELSRRVVEAVGQVAGIERVDVDIRDMDDDEVVALARLLKGAAPPNPLMVVDASQAGKQAAPPRVNPFTDSRTRILAVASGKGGVGKSSVTTNLSVALADRGHRVAAVDADVWGFSMPRMLGISAPPGLIDDVIIPPEAHGVRLISMGFFAREDQAVIWRGPMLHKALEQFLTDVYWGELDYLVVDMPPGTGDISLSIAQFLPRAEVLVVTTPQPAAQRVAQRAAAMAEKVDLQVIGVVENMSWFTGDDGKRYELFGAGGGEELAGELGVPLLARIPLVPELRAGGDVGRPIVASDPDGEVAQVFRTLAERLDTDLAPKRIYNPELKLN